MGWASGGDVFDPVARTMIMLVKGNHMLEDTAFETLVTLARALRQSDWDTEDESAERFADHSFVLNALITAGAGCSDCRKFCGGTCRD